MQRGRGFVYTGLLLIIAIIIGATYLVLRTNSYLLKPGPVKYNSIFTQLTLGDTETIKIFTIDNQKLKRVVALPTYKSNSFGVVAAVLSKDKIYYLEGKALYAYNLTNGLRSAIYNLKDDLDYYRISLDGEGVYLSYTSFDPTGQSPHYIDKISPSTNTSETIGPFAPQIYSGFGVLEQIGGQRVFASGGGDGCGSWLTLYTQQGENFSSIGKFARGCIDSPRYLGHDENGIYMVTVIKGSYDYGKGSLYDKIFYTDIAAGEFVELASLTKLYNNHLISTAFTPEHKLFLGKTEDEILIYNIDSGELKNIPLSGTFLSFFLAPEVIYLNAAQSKVIYQLDYDDLTLTLVSYNNTFAQENSEQIQYLGEHQGQPIFSVVNKYE